MKYSQYQTGLKHLRKVLLSDREDISGHFGKFYVQRGRTGKSGFSGVWNAKTNNIVALVNKKGTVFVRENSIYSGQLLSSEKHKVVKGKHLKNFRGSVNRSIRRDVECNMYAEIAYQNLKANNNKVGEVKLLIMPRETQVDGNYLLAMLQQKVKKDGKLEGTYRSLADTRNITAHDFQTREVRELRLNVQDFTAVIERERAIDGVKRDIILFMLDNYDMYRENVLTNSQGLGGVVMAKVDINGVTYMGTVGGRLLERVRDGSRTIDDAIDHIGLEPEEEIRENFGYYPEEEYIDYNPMYNLRRRGYSMSEYATFAQEYDNVTPFGHGLVSMVDDMPRPEWTVEERDATETRHVADEVSRGMTEPSQAEVAYEDTTQYPAEASDIG